MANRRPRLSGIACLQCESRLLQSSANRRFSRLATPSLCPGAVRPSAAPNPATYSLPTRNHAANAIRKLHGGGGISLGRQAEALASTKSRSDSDDGIILNGRSSGNNRLSDLVVDDVLIDGDIIEEPLIDERVSPAEAEQIWTSLLGDEGEPTEDDVFGYIDELQPTDERILPQSVYKNIAHSLSEGFTTSQLVSYVRKKRKPTTARPVYPWEKKRRPWVPDAPGQNTYHALYGKKNSPGEASGNRIVTDAKVKAIGPGSALLLQGYINSSMTNKDKVIAQLMRECWGVSISEVMEAPGKLLVEVREVEFALLEGGAQSWLRDISTAFSTVTTTTATGSKSSSRSTSKGQTRHNRRIELYAGRRTVRISAPASVADAMMAEINRVLKSVTTKRFSLEDIARPGVVISEDALKAVGALTGSWVRHSTGRASALDADGDRKQDKAEVVVSWVTPKATAASTTAVEDTGDVVYRLLLHTFGPSAVVAAPNVEESAMPTSSGNSLYLDHRPLKKSKGRFLVCEANSSFRAKLGWHDRLGKWARWIEPMLRAQVMEAERYAKLKVVPGVWSLPFDFTLGAAPSTRDAKWHDTIQSSTVSALGRVLHEQDHDAKTPVYGVGGTVPPEEPALRVPDVRRAFLAVTPPLLGLKLDGAEDSEVASSTTIVLRFLPGTKASSGSNAPPIELTLDASTEGEQPVLTSLRVISAFSVCDTLFPTQMVDARTTQKRFYELPGADILASATDAAEANPLAPLLTFLQQSNIDLRDSSKFITTPLHLHKLGLPRAVLGDRANGDAGDQDETVYVDYLFSGAEVRRRVATPFQGWTLSLTNVQTGLGQARWTELGLEAVPAGTAAAQGAAADVHSKESFRNAVGDLVHGDAIQWRMPVGEVLC
ncbi:hypothetical protein F503_02284 [Ophiostoma piceae UAMH 11346]|uniref:Uncharacterized protein n=1 Tax=Ophiostoma piceae (strain UAMH 11346) TaxID=1262450 RepID=S3CXF9_OPHP1|nr:hypothetical protein F503_02284 [Ophiostoma piceae UAMH 11346]